jgi:hypothetical protein
VNRYRIYLTKKPSPGKKTSEQIAADIEEYIDAGGQIAVIPCGVTAFEVDVGMGKLNNMHFYAD